MTPKIILIVLVTFFPVTVGLLDGFRSVDKDAIGPLRSMGANRRQIFRYIKFPSALPQLFSGIRIAAAYAVVGAVISEWPGGFGGLGVYMTRVKQAFAFDKMFAVIFLISAISLVLMALVDLAQEYTADTERWGEFDADRWAAFYTWLNDNQLLEHPIDPNAGFSNSYLPND